MYINRVNVKANEQEEERQKDTQGPQQRVMGTECGAKRLLSDVLEKGAEN
jgi:hypothetical protein